MKIVYLIESGQRREVHRADSFAEGIQFLFDHHRAAYVAQAWVIVNGDALDGLKLPKMPGGLRA
jgi:hypothetical protein